MYMMIVPRKNFDLFDDFFDDPFFTRSERHAHPMPMMKTDIRENEKNYIIDVDLPGFEKENIKIDVEDGYLNINASMNSSEDEEAMDNVDDTASEQAYDDLTSESFVGKELDIKTIKLNESMEDYFILKGAQDNNVNLICCNYEPKKRNLKCRLKNKSIMVNLKLKDL